MFTPLSFGDVFSIDGKDYIFFAQTPDITYAARILDKYQTLAVGKSFKTKLAKGINTEKTILYCFVELKTEDFKDRSVLVANTGMDLFGTLKKQEVMLIQSDIDALKEEILNGIGASQELKDLIKKL
jgi:hypothetical protein